MHHLHLLCVVQFDSMLRFCSVQEFEKVMFCSLLPVCTHRADIITENQAKGLGNFVSKFALPALLFKNMVLLDFGDVIWAFLWSVLVAKVGVRICRWKPNK